MLAHSLCAQGGPHGGVVLVVIQGADLGQLLLVRRVLDRERGTVAGHLLAVDQQSRLHAEDVVRRASCHSASD